MSTCKIISEALIYPPLGPSLSSEKLKLDVQSETGIALGLMFASHYLGEFRNEKRKVLEWKLGYRAGESLSLILLHSECARHGTFANNTAANIHPVSSDKKIRNESWNWDSCIWAVAFFKIVWIS